MDRCKRDGGYYGSTINAMREYFSVWGLPQNLVTDNGPSFTSENFSNFLMKNVLKRY